MPSDSETVYYWGNARPRYLSANTDVPELPEDWHEVLVIGGQRRMAKLLRRSVEEQNVLKGEYEHLLKKMRKVDLPMGGARKMTYQSSFKSRYTPRRSYRTANDVYPYSRR